MDSQALVLVVVLAALVLLSLLNPRLRDWLLTHASAIWVAALIIVGAILVFAGYQVSPEGRRLAEWLNTLGQAILTTGLIAVFLSLPDTASYFAKIASSLLSSGELLGALSNSAKLSVARKLLDDRLSKKGICLHAPLADHMARLTDNYLSHPHLSNYRYTTHLSHCNNDHGMVLNHSVLRYRIHVNHLSSGTFTLPLRYAFEWEIAPTFKDEIDSLVRRFRVKVGSNEYTEASLIIERKEVSDGTRVKASFVVDLALAEDSDVIIESLALADPEDPIDLFFVRYPTNGFSAQLRYDDASRFDYAMFSPIACGVESMSRGDPTEGPGTIEISTSDWILPGCGLVLSFVPKRLVQ